MGFSVFAQDNWVAPLEAKEIVNPYDGNQIAAQKGGCFFKNCVGLVMEKLVWATGPLVKT